MRILESATALALITLALVGCSKEPAPTTMNQQIPSGVQVVTNADGSISMFQNVIKRNTNNARTQQTRSGVQAVTNDDGSVFLLGSTITRTNVDGSVSTFTTRIKHTTNSAPVTNGPH